AYDRLGFDCADFQRIHDSLLNLCRGASGSPDGPSRIRDGNVSLAVDLLWRPGNEIFRTNPGLGRNVEPARSSLQQRHGKDIANAEAQIGGAAPVMKRGVEPWHVCGEDAEYGGRQSDESVGEADGGLRPTSHVSTDRPRHRYYAAAA